LLRGDPFGKRQHVGGAQLAMARVHASADSADHAAHQVPGVGAGIDHDPRAFIADR
jgi:hypothetical protein